MDIFEFEIVYEENKIYQIDKVLIAAASEKEAFEKIYSSYPNFILVSLVTI